MNYKSLPNRVFQIIQSDLFDRTVKIPRTNKPLCTGGNRVDYRDFDEPVDVSANQEGAYDQPNFVIQLNLPSSEFPYNVEMGRGRSWGQLNDYLTQEYGLTQEECDRVWDEYRTTICKNPQLPTLHESKSFNPTNFNFLEKVSQTMDDNTPIYYKEDALHIEFPYFNITTHQTYRAPKSKWGNDKLRHYDTQLQSIKEIITGLWTIIGGKIMDIFGLTHDEADLVYKWYQELLQRKAEEVLSPIFEESEKKLNESRDKQQRVLDYAVQDMVENTLLDWGSETEYPYQIIRFPFSIYPNKDPRKNPLKKNRLEWIMIDRKYKLDITQFYDQFKTHAQTMYGLTDVELLKVFGEWEGKVIEKIRDHSETDPPGYINESTDKQEKYLQYIITTLLNETIIDKENEEVHLPWGMMYVNVFSNFAGIDKDLHNPAEDLTGDMARGFWDTMMGTYGLKQDEVERVWKIYGPTLSKKMHLAWFDDWIELMSRI